MVGIVACGFDGDKRPPPILYLVHSPIIFQNAAFGECESSEQNTSDSGACVRCSGKQRNRHDRGPIELTCVYFRIAAWALRFNRCQREKVKASMGLSRT